MQSGLDTMLRHSNSIDPLLPQELVESEYYYYGGIRTLTRLFVPKNCGILMTLFCLMIDQSL